jgi:hypothetical protein
MAWNEYQVRVAAQAPADERTAFIRKTYLHLGAAVLAFVGVLAVLDGAIGESMMRWVIGGRYTWLLVMLGFMGLSAIANNFAVHPHSKGMQYAGLALYVVAEAFIFLPLIHFAAHYVQGPVLQTAAIYTLIVFGGLTGIVFLTGKDFSFLRQELMLAGWASIGFIVCSIIFGFSLGIVFSALMVLFAAGYILYYTSNVLHHYPIGSHVAAALALFASVALLFWYILNILLSRRD